MAASSFSSSLTKIIPGVPGIICKVAVPFRLNIQYRYKAISEMVLLASSSASNAHYRFLLLPLFAVVKQIYLKGSGA